MACAGCRWAKSILYHEKARDEFRAFFERKDTFALGVCNGCQMMSALKDLIPGMSAGVLRHRRAGTVVCQLMWILVGAGKTISHWLQPEMFPLF